MSTPCDDEDGLRAVVAFVRSRAFVIADGLPKLIPGQQYLVEIRREDGETISVQCSDIARVAHLLSTLMPIEVAMKASAEEVEAVHAMTLELAGRPGDNEITLH